MGVKSVRFYLIKYIIYKEFPLSVLSNYINYENIIRRSTQNDGHYLYLNIAAVYLSCKVEGQHLCIKEFTRSIRKYLSQHTSFVVKDVTEEYILKYEREMVVLLDYKFVFNCFFKKLYGILIFKEKTKEFEAFKEKMINKILIEEVPTVALDEYLKSI